MKVLSDQELLSAYAECRSEAAFAELVYRHIDLVHSAALRMVRDPHLAKDVSQGVFVALARDAGKLSNHPVLSGWLHRTARNIAAQAVRTEVRRRNREKEATTMNEFSETDVSWEEIAPHLDSALAELGESDRDAILLRYFENKSAKHMAAILGISAEAAQKRVSRAVEHLRENLAKRGITAGAAGLAGVIAANAVQAAPLGLAATISAAALVGTASAVIAATKTVAMTTTGKALTAAAIIVLAGAGIYYARLTDPQAKGPTSPEPQAAMTTPKPRPPQGDSLTEKLAQSRAGKPPIDRQKELARLKLQWMELKPKGNYGLNEQKALAKESAELLLCSREAVELLFFLKENELWGEGPLKHEISRLFDSPRAAEARQLLTELPETAEITGPGSYKQGGESYRDEWSMAAGKTCPDDEFETFRAALNCKSCAIEALYGHNQRLMASDPQAAFSSSLEAFKSGIPAFTGIGGVTQLFEVKNCPKFDFRKFEEQLPPDGPKDESHGPYGDEEAFTLIRRKLFWHWAEIDPAAAANHVMANPDRLVPRLMEEIVGGYSRFKDSKVIIAWVATFPEGPYFDAAAKSAASSARGTPEIDELIQKIQDPKMREEAMERARVPLCNPNTR